jgi:hypothetical protein
MGSQWRGRSSKGARFKKTGRHGPSRVQERGIVAELGRGARKRSRGS